MKNYVVWLLVFILPGAVFAAQVDSTPTPQPMRSVFDYDTCTPPCWLGLIPDRSTPGDVEAVLHAHPDLIDPASINMGIARLPTGDFDVDPDTGYMRTGGYYFDIGQVDYIPGYTSSRIEIERGFVDLMVILAHPETTTSLAQVLDRLGPPSIIRFYVNACCTTRLFLIYLEPPMRVNLIQPTDTCRTSTLLEQAVLESVLYFSPEAARDVFPSVDYEYIPQSALTGYRLLNERNIPSETWQAWLDDDMDLSCEAAWAQLPEPEIVPAIEKTPEP